MSVHGIIEAMRSDYAPAIRIVWQCLENHANGHRVWSSSIDDMAAELHLDRDTVQRAVLKLEKDEIVEIERRRRHASTYHMKRTYPPTGSGKNGSGNGLETEIPTPNGELKTEKPTPTMELKTGKPTPTAPLETEKPAPTVHNGHLFEPEKPRPTPKLDTEKTPSSKSTKKESTREGRARAPASRRPPARTLIPPEWKPNAEQEGYATGLGFEPGRLARRFVLWHRRKHTLSPDWAAEWEWWCDNEVRLSAEQDNDPRGNGMVKVIAQEGWVSARRNGHDRDADAGAKVIEGIFGHA